MSRKDKDKKEPAKEQTLRITIAEIIQGFYQEEKGNKVTSNNMDGLLGKLIRVVVLHEAKAGKEEGSC